MELGRSDTPRCREQLASDAASTAPSRCPVLVLGVGLVAGALAALLGIGGGVIYVPALVILFDLVQQKAQGTSLVAILPAALIPVALLPGMLSEGAPNFLRPIAAQSVAYLFPALAASEGLAWLRRRLKGPAWGRAARRAATQRSIPSGRRSKSSTYSERASQPASRSMVIEEIGSYSAEEAKHPQDMSSSWCSAQPRAIAAATIRRRGLPVRRPGSAATSQADIIAPLALHIFQQRLFVGGQVN